MKKPYVFLLGMLVSFLILETGEFIGYSKLTAAWNHQDYIKAVTFTAEIFIACLLGNYIGEKFYEFRRQIKK